MHGAKTDTIPRALSLYNTQTNMLIAMALLTPVNSQVFMSILVILAMVCHRFMGWHDK
jgi:hypothetical protein